MTEQLFRIKPLVWKYDRHFRAWNAQSPFGEYTVWKGKSTPLWILGDEYPGRPCKTPAIGRVRCEKDFLARIRAALEEVK